MKIEANPAVNFYRNQSTNYHKELNNYTFMDTLRELKNTQNNEDTTTIPTYQLSQDQIHDLKSRYNLEDISKEDFQKLMDELKLLGVISEDDSKFISKTTVGGMEFVRRPIILGLFKQETAQQFFNYEVFESGDILNWISEMVKQNESAIDWLSNSKQSLNDDLQNLKNTVELKKYNQDINRLMAVLKKL